MRTVTLVLFVLMLTQLVPRTITSSNPLYAGYCEGGQPVVTHWDPKLDQLFTPVCLGEVFSIAQKEMEHLNPPETARPYPDPPADWSSWAEIWLNDKAMRNPYDDVVPFVSRNSGRTLIPLRMVTEAMGGKAEWNAATREVTIRLNDKYMVMTIDQPQANANGKIVSLDQPPILWMDRTMVPLRVLAEAFGAEVGWTAAFRRVDIRHPDVECAPGYCWDWI